jgi:hypothetical protein
MTEDEVEDLSEQARVLRFPNGKSIETASLPECTCGKHHDANLLPPAPDEIFGDDSLKRDPGQAINAVAEREIPRLRNQLIGIFESMQRGIDEYKLIYAMENSDLDRAFDAVPWSMLERMDEAILKSTGDVLNRSGKVAAKALSLALEGRETHQVGISFDIQNPRIQEWIAANTGKRIVEIGEETRLAVRDIIKRAFDEGMHPYESAREIRKIVGLTSRQAQAVANYRERLVGQGLSDAQVEKQSDKYYRKLLKYRSENIARTETLAAGNAGQHEAWEQAADAGLIDRAKTQRVWITHIDERTCPRCEPLNGRQVGFREQFSSTLKKKLNPAK